MQFYNVLPEKNIANFLARKKNIRGKKKNIVGAITTQPFEQSEQCKSS